MISLRCTAPPNVVSFGRTTSGDAPSEADDGASEGSNLSLKRGKESYRNIADVFGEINNLPGVGLIPMPMLVARPHLILSSLRADICERS